MAAKFQRLMTIYENHHVRGPGHVLDIISFIKFLVFFQFLDYVIFPFRFCFADSIFLWGIFSAIVLLYLVLYCVYVSHMYVCMMSVSVSMCM